MEKKELIKILISSGVIDEEGYLTYRESEGIDGTNECRKND